MFLYINTPKLLNLIVLIGKYIKTNQYPDQVITLTF